MDRPGPMRRPEREPVTSWMPASAWREHREHAYPRRQTRRSRTRPRARGAHAVHGPRAVGGQGRAPARRAAARRKGRLLGPGPGAGAPGAARGGGDRADRGAPPRRGSPQPQGRRPPRAGRRPCRCWSGPADTSPHTRPPPAGAPLRCTRCTWSRGQTAARAHGLRPRRLAGRAAGRGRHRPAAGRRRRHAVRGPSRPVPGPAPPPAAGAGGAGAGVPGRGRGHPAAHPGRRPRGGRALRRGRRPASARRPRLGRGGGGRHGRGGTGLAAPGPVRVRAVRHGVRRGGGSGWRAPSGGEARRAGSAIVQVHSLADPTLVIDAARLWSDDEDESGDRAPTGSAQRVTPSGRAPGSTRCSRCAGPPASGRRSGCSWSAVCRTSCRSPRTSCTSCSARRRRASPRRASPCTGRRELARTLSATAVVRPAPGSATDGTSFFDAEELLAFNWQLALGGEPLSEPRWMPSPSPTARSCGCATSGWWPTRTRAQGQKAGAGPARAGGRAGRRAHRHRRGRRRDGRGGPGRSARRAP